MGQYMGPQNMGAQAPPEFLTISRVLNNEKVPIYGAGKIISDWLHVLDQCAAIDLVLHEGVNSTVYNVSGHNERTNVEVVKTIIKASGKSEDFIEFVEDYKG